MTKDIQKHRKRQIFFIVLMLLYILSSLVYFNKSVEKRKENMNLIALQDLATQSAAILNEEIEYYFEFLQGLANLSKAHELDDPALIEEIENFTISSKFQRFGVADIEGNAIITNGKKINISDRDFFKKSLKGENVISDTLESKLIDDQIIMCSVPIYDVKDHIRGVLYGVLNDEEIERFHKSVLENEYYYVHVIDGDGHYVYHSNNTHRIVRNNENFFDGMKELKMNYSIEEIKENLAADQNMIVEASRGQDHRMIYFSNLDHSNWCAISVVDQAYVTENINSLLRQDVLLLTLNISGALIVLGIIFLYYLNKEKNYINKLNNKLARNEIIYKTAAFSEDNIVFVYDVRKNQLKFISGDLKLFTLNETIYNALDTILDKFDHSGNIDEIISSMRKVVGEKETDFKDEVVVIIDGKKCYFNLYASSIFGIDGHIEMIVGNIRDITAKKEDLRSLLKKAEIDALTGTYNRGGGILRVKESLLKQGNHSLILLDLDHFKELNDRLGHKFGDQALCDVSTILKNYFHKEDIICRLGGDEFIVFIENISKDVTIRIIHTLLKRLNLVYQNGNEKVSISASIGIVLIPDDGVQFEELLEKVDRALYQAKSLGRNRYCLYEGDKMNEDKTR